MKVMGPSPHVLVVDDEVAVCETVAAVLSAHSYTVFQANTAADALAILNSTHIDLVVLDVEIGEEPGLELLVKIKEAHPSIRVVMLTGRGYDEQTLQAARSRGAIGYLSKALPPTHLLMEVDRWLRFR